MRSADAVDPGEGYGRSVLEEEREFLLRSLRDLDAERAAGDIDDADYARLRDDYTVRAAEVIRRLAVPDGVGEPAGVGGAARPVAGAARASEAGLLSAGLPAAGEAGLPAAGLPADGEADGAGDEGAAGADDRRAMRRLRRRRLVWAALATVAAIGIGVAAAAASGVRLPGETITGSPTGVDAIDQKLIAAQKAIDAKDPLEAVKDYQSVLATDPTNPEALTGYGAVLVETDNAQLVARGAVMLADAESSDPSYGPAYAYLGRALTVLGDYSRAIRQLDRFIADDRTSPLLSQARQLLRYAESKEAAPSKGSGSKAAGSGSAG